MVEQFSDPPPCCLDGSFLCFAQERFELGEDLLDWVEVGAVGWQEEEPCAGISDCPAHGLSLVASEVVHDDDIAGPERRHQHLAYISGEPFPVDRPVEHKGSVDPVVAQRGDEGHGAPVAVGGLGAEGPSPGIPAVRADHVGLGPGLVNEDQPRWIKPSLIFFPPQALAGDVRTILLGGEHGFF